MSENLQAGDDLVPARSASLLVAHTSQTNALLAKFFELFFNSLVNRSKKRLLKLRYNNSNLCARHNTPGADLVVGVTGEQSLAISGPSEGDTLGVTALLALLNELRLELINLALLLEVEDGDGAAGGSAEPVAVGGEDESVDLIAGGEGVEVLGLVKVPEHGGTVLATGSAEGSIGGDSDGVDVTGVTDVIGLETARSELPNLNAGQLSASLPSKWYEIVKGKFFPNPPIVQKVRKNKKKFVAVPIRQNG
jgi:hypothetical protein